MEDTRVWTMTLAAVGAMVLIGGLCGGVLLLGVVSGRSAMSAPVYPATAAAVAAPAPIEFDAAVLLEDTLLYPETEIAAKPLQPLQAGQNVTVLERSAQRRICRDSDCLDLRHQPLEFDPEGEGHFWYRVRTAEGAEGWVFGRHLAIRSGSGMLGEVPNLGWEPRTVWTEDLDQDGTEERIWFAVRDVGYEWPSSMLDRTPAGYLVVSEVDSDRSATTSVAGILIGNYGDRIGNLQVRDATGDGHPELLLRIDTTVSEVGYGGHDVVILRYRDGALEELFREHATISLIAGVGEYRWSRIDIGAGEITQDVVDLEVYSKCRGWTIDEPDTAGDRCLRGEHRLWRWDHEAQRFAVVTEDDALRVKATVGPAELAFRAEPDLTAPTAGTYATNADVLVQQIHGWSSYEETEGLEGHWVLAVDTGGAAGWVPSSQLRFADGMLQPYMRGDHSSEGQVDPVVW